MKKILVLFLIVFLLMSFACGGNMTSDKYNNPNDEREQNIINDDSAGNGDDSTSIQTDKTPETNGDNELPLVPIG